MHYTSACIIIYHIDICLALSHFFLSLFKVLVKSQAFFLDFQLAFCWFTTGELAPDAYRWWPAVHSSCSSCAELSCCWISCLLAWPSLQIWLLQKLTCSFRLSLSTESAFTRNRVIFWSFILVVGCCCCCCCCRFREHSGLTA